jgi:hypothetical protein
MVCQNRRRFPTVPINSACVRRAVFAVHRLTRQQWKATPANFSRWPQSARTRPDHKRTISYLQSTLARGVRRTRSTSVIDEWPIKWPIFQSRRQTAARARELKAGAGGRDSGARDGHRWIFPLIPLPHAERGQKQNAFGFAAAAHINIRWWIGSACAAA